jgi:hypothetical protein
MIAGGVARAPRIAKGYPRKSPKLWLYRNPRYRGQLIGSCVGESGAAMGETSIRTPSPMPSSRDTVSPLPPVNLSPLWVYYIARRYSRDNGRPISGEGAIVSDAMAAVVKEGHILYDAWPATEANYANYNDKPPASAISARRIPVRGEAQILTDSDHVLEYLGAGFSVWIGVGWKGSDPTPDGMFGWSGWAQGGHAVELLGYDLDRDLVCVGNSWDNARWGIQPGGYGYTKWTALARDLSARNLDSGTNEACVITELQGVDPVPIPTPDPVPIPIPTPNSEVITIIYRGKSYPVTVDT